MKENVASAIKKELKIDKAKISEEDKTKGVTSIGNITMEQVVKIAKEKRDILSAKDFKSAVKQVVGTITSMQGILIEGKKSKEIIQDINEGKWDDLIKS
jgi:large subunit ribosomal protein L11